MSLFPPFLSFWGNAILQKKYLFCLYAGWVGDVEHKSKASDQTPLNPVVNPFAKLSWKYYIHTFSLSLPGPPTPLTFAFGDHGLFKWSESWNTGRDLRVSSHFRGQRWEKLLAQFLPLVRTCDIALGLLSFLWSFLPLTPCFCPFPGFLWAWGAAGVEVRSSFRSSVLPRVYAWGNPESR